MERSSSSGDRMSGGGGAPVPSAAGRPRVPDADWSVLMARSQDGDQLAYATLLKSVTPYVRALAARVGLTGDDGEDAV